MLDLLIPLLVLFSSTKPLIREGSLSARLKSVCKERMIRKEARYAVMLMIKGDPEPGAVPSDELLTAMGRYNDDLKRAEVLIDLAGLLPSANGRRVKYSRESRTVIDGPFDEPKTLVAATGSSR